MHTVCVHVRPCGPGTLQTTHHTVLQLGPRGKAQAMKMSCSHATMLAQGQDVVDGGHGPLHRNDKAPRLL